MYLNIKDPVSHVFKLVNSDVQLGFFSSFHCGWSSIFFALMCVISTLDTISKTEINCIGDKGLISQAAMDTYCLIQSIYTTHTANETTDEHVIDDISYYLWVPYVLFISFVFTLIGFILYKQILCGDYLCTLMSSIKIATNFEKKEILTKKEIQDYLNKLLTKERIKADADRWVYSYVVMEVVHTITPFLQFFYLDLFLNGNFIWYGSYLNDQHHYDVIFPKMAKCTIHTIGSSGSIQNHELLCVLSKNILYEKIFVLVWFWLVFMCFLATGGIFWRFFTFLCFKCNWFNNYIWRQNGISGSKQYTKYVQFLSKKLRFCPWLYLFYVARNSDLFMFEVLLNNLLKEYSFDGEKKEDSKEEDEDDLFFNIRKVIETKKESSDDDASRVNDVEFGNNPQNGNAQYVLIPYDYGVMDLLQKILIILGRNFGFSRFFWENNKDQVDSHTCPSVTDPIPCSNKDDHSSAGAVLHFKEIESQLLSTKVSQRSNKNKTLCCYGSSVSLDSEVKVGHGTYSPVASHRTPPPARSGNDSSTAPMTVTLYAPEHPDRTLPVHDVKVLVNGNCKGYGDSNEKVK